MPTITTLSADELERMMASVSPPVATDREVRRLALKEKSEDRKSQWPNTIEAMRMKKDRWKKDKEEREEEARKRIDEEEAKLQKDARTRQIERANRLLNEQTDRMKTLRSKQLLVDVIHHRKLQLQEKAMIREQEKMVDQEYDRRVLDGVLRGEEEEIREKMRLHKEHEALAHIQKQQLEEYKQRYIAQLREEKKDGELMKQKTEVDLREEMEKERARKMQAKQAGEETKLANLRLKAHKEALMELERIEDEKREADEQKKKEQNAKRDALRREKFAKAQARKQRMIDLATENLVKMEQKGEARLENQFKEVRAKEDRDLKERADRRAAEREAIFQSRQSQLEQKAAARGAEKQKAEEAVKQWEDYGKKVDMQMRQDEYDVRLENLRFAVSQKQQADARKKMLMEERAAELLMDAQAKVVLGREDDKFREVALQALEEAKVQGIENVFPIKVALAEKRVDLLAALGFRV